MEKYITTSKISFPSLSICPSDTYKTEVLAQEGILESVSNGIPQGLWIPGKIFSGKSVHNCGNGEQKYLQFFAQQLN